MQQILGVAAVVVRLPCIRIKRQVLMNTNYYKPSDCPCTSVRNVVDSRRDPNTKATRKISGQVYYMYI